MKKTVAEQRDYKIINTTQVKEILILYLKKINLTNIELGLPEINDRYHEWKVTLLNCNKFPIGNLVIDAYTGKLNELKSTKIEILKRRLGYKENTSFDDKRLDYEISPLKNTVERGDSLNVLDQLPDESIDLIFTSPPYFNARPEYKEYDDYDEYLETMRQIIRKASRTLVSGRFFIMNISHVLIARISRNHSSTRIAVPFDMHQIFIEEGFEFIDDIIWEKPSGAGWASGRGRRFAQDRNPLQYKAVPVTEYVLVYRKKSNRLIDWFIRKHPNQDLVNESKIGDDYEKTNIWYISPARDKRHNAIFPLELAEKVIKYYSFKGDIVLDPFGGIGTTAKAALKLGRKFFLIEKENKYYQEIKNDLEKYYLDIIENNEINFIENKVHEHSLNKKDLILEKIARHQKQIDILTSLLSEE